VALAQRIRRLGEAAAFLGRYAADWPSRKTLFRAYQRSLHSTTDTTEAALRLRVGGTVVPLRIRLSDIYTLAEIFHERQYELRTPLPLRPIIVDAGANIGVASLWFSARYPGARIVALEPAPDNLRLLRENLGSLPDATVLGAAVAKTAAPVALHLAEHGALHSAVDTSLDDAPTVEVPGVTLADVMVEHDLPRIDLLKIDVEGSELDALEGLGPRLAQVGVIAGEMHERLVSEEAFYGLLERSGFRVLHRTYYGNGRLDGVHAFEAARVTAGTA
jgi:FkbM family methyltransferase